MRGIRSRIALSLACAVVVVVGATAAVPSHARAHRADRIPLAIARVLPAVVSVITLTTTRDDAGQASQSRGLGSGVIVDRRGYVFTNHHVVAGAGEVTVTSANRRVFGARVVGVDADNDIAVLKIDGRGDFPVALLGDSSRLALGETVIAIGTPMWIEDGPTVTVGVVSGLGRSMEEPGLPMLHDLIQTDAALNPGNSGGPLVNLAGQVVAINTVIIPTAHGIGFAIPVNGIRPSVRELVGSGRLVRPSLGVMAISMTPQLRSANDLSIRHGALVLQVEGDVPEQPEGVRPGDVILGVTGRSVRSLRDLRHVVSHHRVGDTITVTVWRDGQPITVKAVVR